VKSTELKSGYAILAQQCGMVASDTP